MIFQSGKPVRIEQTSLNVPPIPEHLIGKTGIAYTSNRENTKTLVLIEQDMYWIPNDWLKSG